MSLSHRRSIQNARCMVIWKYNGRHTCTMGTFSQDHSKLDSDTIAEVIRPLVETDPSLKVKSIIAAACWAYSTCNIHPPIVTANNPPFLAKTHKNFM
ncbi:hypothetical protein AHAS_Ahas19G0167800 [Arachis hypogaea]